MKAQLERRKLAEQPPRVISKSPDPPKPVPKPVAYVVNSGADERPLKPSKAPNKFVGCETAGLAPDSPQKEERCGTFVKQEEEASVPKIKTDSEPVSGH